MNDIGIIQPPLAVGSQGQQASGWWGMIGLILSEAALFAYLFFSYFYLQSQDPNRWPPHGPLALRISLPSTVLLIAGSVTLWWGERGIRQSRQGRLLAGLLLSMGIGIVFLALQLHEWRSQGFSPRTSAFGSLYYTMTGFHMAHLVAGLLMLAVMTLWAGQHKFDARRHAAISIGALYWHFVTLVWVLLFFILYLAPRMG